MFSLKNKRAIFFEKLLSFVYFIVSYPFVPGRLPRLSQGPPTLSTVVGSVIGSVIGLVGVVEVVPPLMRAAFEVLSMLSENFKLFNDFIVRKF
jgi:hypothetical protein